MGSPLIGYYSSSTPLLSSLLPAPPFTPSLPPSHSPHSPPLFSPAQDGLYDRLGKPGTLPTVTAEPPSVVVDGTEETLPSGWNEYRTPEGKTYYHNEKTGISSWMKPKGSARKRTVGMHHGGQSCVLSGTRYVHRFYNTCRTIRGLC